MAGSLREKFFGQRIQNPLSVRIQPVPFAVGIHFEKMAGFAGQQTIQPAREERHRLHKLPDRGDCPWRKLVGFPCLLRHQGPGLPPVHDAAGPPRSSASANSASRTTTTVTSRLASTQSWIIQGRSGASCSADTRVVKRMARFPSRLEVRLFTTDGGASGDPEEPTATNRQEGTGQYRRAIRTCTKENRLVSICGNHPSTGPG